MAIGSFSSFIVGIVSPMILSRYFDKGDYGTYKQVMYVYYTLLSIFTLGLPMSYAYFLPKYEREYAKDIISKVTKLFFVLGASFSLFLFFFAGSISNVMKNPDLKPALMAFAPTPFLLLPTMGLDSIFATYRKTHYLVYYTIVTKVLTILLTVLPVVILGGNYIHAIIGFDIASFLTCVLALYLKTWPVRDEPKHKSDITVRQIFNFALPLLFASIWGIIIASSNQFFISRYYGSEVFADFSNGFMELPFVGMILSSISAVLLPLFSGMTKGNGLSQDVVDVWHSALNKSVKLIFPMLVFSILFAKPIMTCLYGDKYIQSAIYFQIKNFSGLFFIIPFYPIILAIGKSKDYARVHMIIALLIVIAEYVVCNFTDSPVYVAIVSELCQILKIWLLLKVIADYAGISAIKLVNVKMLLKVLSVSLLSTVLPKFVECHLSTSIFAELGVCLILYVCSYYFLCWLMGISYKEIAKPLLRNGLFDRFQRIIP